jgi:uncharacterized repeat protein (TIGR02543 family)
LPRGFQYTNHEKDKYFYKPEIYNITYYDNNNIIDTELIPENYRTYSVLYGVNNLKENVSDEILKINKNGYAFNGWKTNEDKLINSVNITNPNIKFSNINSLKDYIDTRTIGDLQLEANFQPNNYIYTFNFLSQHTN